jgi:octaheme c-type cytochrome (tetrathionate reductase family)
MRRAFLASLALALWSGAGLAADTPAAAAASAQPAPVPQSAPAAPARSSASTVDHTRLKQLDRDFGSGPEVTKACLECHTEAAKQIHLTVHWTWDFLNPESKQRLGKKNVVNNFCTAVPSNYAFCSGCHVGYGWKDESFDFKSEANVDCLVCHDTTGSYRKLPGLAGHPAYKDMEFPPHSGKTVKAVDLKKVAQNVGKTSRKTCGSCHFFGGGGDGFKHGDMDSSLTLPGRYLDVHMDAKGLNFSCATCHMTTGHQVPGSRYMPTASDKEGRHIRGKADKSNPVTCVACHDNAPHKKDDRLDAHARKIACQTCHIPQYARGNVATKTLWDWSTAGRLSPEGKPITVKDSAGRVTYDSKKGDFRYDSHAIPSYVWFNGKVNYTLVGEPIAPEGVTKINSFGGAPDDPASMIWPVKVFHGKQPYDVQTKSLVIPHTFGGEGDDTAFWSNFDWEKAIATGMKSASQPFSGQFGFVATEMSWPITHMVAPKEDALSCEQCHSRGGRLAAVAGIYIPGRDRLGWLDALGYALAGLSLLGVLGHGALRYFAHRKQGR